MRDSPTEVHIPFRAGKRCTAIVGWLFDSESLDQHRPSELCDMPACWLTINGPRCANHHLGG